ncbi:MAG TPA: carbohydrate kinase family protein [Pyrodictium delaneyi]|uniref:Carbohydrate kinase family protein n=1 Tax=Pyrodictium delaneyi TaxID=1273541 RepID=A0A833EAV8_9CREN|nr:carbohydrate kinase family protein [Pyrodictium delaneyi]
MKLETPKHIAVGNLNIDVYMIVDYIPGPDENAIAREAYVGPGGAAANYSVAVARLGHRVSLLGHTGRLAEQLGVLRLLQESGVDISLVRIHDDEMPGMVIVLVAPSGERTMITMRGANNLLRGDEAQGVAANVLHVASRGTDVLQRVASTIRSSIVSYDPGGAVARREASHILDVARDTVDVLMLNRVEYKLVAGDRPLSEAQGLLGGRLKYIIVKKGAEGAVLVAHDGLWHVEAFRAGEVVDTTGAGDVFIAVFNSYLVERGDYIIALQAASIAAGIKVTRRGAQSVPGREEIEKFLHEKPPKVREYR